MTLLVHIIARYVQQNDFKRYFLLILCPQVTPLEVPMVFTVALPCVLSNRVVVRESVKKFTSSHQRNCACSSVNPKFTTTSNVTEWYFPPTALGNICLRTRETSAFSVHIVVNRSEQNILSGRVWKLPRVPNIPGSTSVHSGFFFVPRKHIKVVSKRSPGSVSEKKAVSRRTYSLVSNTWEFWTLSDKSTIIVGDDETL